MKIYFSGARIGEKRLLSRVLDYAVENLRQPERLSLSLSFLDEEKMRALNKETRGADKPTDVLSFQYLDYIKAGEKVDLDRKEYFDVVTGLVDLGEIYICRSIARRQAKEYSCTASKEKRRFLRFTVFCICWATTMTAARTKGKCSQFRKISLTRSI